MTQTKTLYEYDRAFGVKLLAGCDEAGRGPLAGPVVIAACIMPQDSFIEGVNDSKAVSGKKRAVLYEKITASALAYKIVEIDEQTIERINILNAVKLGMKRAIEGLDIKPQLTLVDAVTKLDIEYRYKSIVKGDAQSYSIAAASILAKVYRDNIMIDLSTKFPQYGFETNKGYGTAAHIEALKQFGRCERHRQSFLSGLEVKDAR